MFLNQLVLCLTAEDATASQVSTSVVHATYADTRKWPLLHPLSSQTRRGKTVLESPSRKERAMKKEKIK